MKPLLPYKSRLATLRNILKHYNGESFFCTTFENILYLSGFQGLSPEEREGTLLITHDNAYLFLPEMYREQGVNLASVKNKDVSLVIDHERDGLLQLFKKIVKKGSQVLVESENLTLYEFDMIMEDVHCELVGTAGIVEQLRLHKDTNEKKILQEVVEKTDKVFEDIVSLLRQMNYTHLTELDIADSLRVFGRKYNLNEFSFEPIVACGAGSSQPHYKTSNKKLEKNTVLLMDFGFKLNGYCSDLTRTIVLGRASEKVRKMYEVVLQCNELSLKAAVTGKEAGSLHQESVVFFKEHNVDQYFIHGLGHGVGIAVHEQPYFRLGRQTKLEEGMVVTIEPGLYFPDEFGIRIEDYVIMGEKDAEILSTSTKELIEI